MSDYLIIVLLFVGGIVQIARPRTVITLTTPHKLLSKRDNQFPKRDESSALRQLWHAPEQSSLAIFVTRSIGIVWIGVSVFMTWIAMYS